MKRRDYANTSILAQRAEVRAKQKWRLSVLHWAIALSLGAHAFLLTVRFVDPERFNKIFKDTPLEVVLVNARSDQRPAIAQAIAQANLAGGGEATSRQRIERLQNEQQQLLAQIRREIALLPPPDPSRDAGTPEDREREQRRKQLLRLLAEIEKRVNEENARPKKRYISPATREADYAIYYDGLRRRIEERGTRDFPEYQGKKLYGELTMNITVDADGRVVEADIVRTSNSRVLDRRAIAIVRAAAPFGRFTTDMRRQTDQIVVTSRFRFTRDEGLETTQLGQGAR
jgi:protein TonB